MKLATVRDHVPKGLSHSRYVLKYRRFLQFSECSQQTHHHHVQVEQWWIQTRWIALPPWLSIDFAIIATRKKCSAKSARPFLSANGRGLHSGPLSFIYDA